MTILDSVLLLGHHVYTRSEKMNTELNIELRSYYLTFWKLRGLGRDGQNLWEQGENIGDSCMSRGWGGHARGHCLRGGRNDNRVGWE